jgi:iron complex transport system substrate-binding protein
MKIASIKRSLLLLLCSVIFLNLLSRTPSVATGPPKRIISLAPNITEILFAMGLADRIVGVTTVCDFPEAARKKPKVGGMSNPSLEAVVSLKPDIVVMTTDGNPKWFEERLRHLHINTYVFRARKISELAQGIRDLGLALGKKEKADALAGDIEKGIDRYRTRYRDIGHSGRKSKMLFIIWPEPLIVAGPNTEINDVITLLGGENVASRARVSYPAYSVEEILREPPDIIFIGKGHADAKEMSKGLLRKLAVVPAVKNGKVFFLSDSLYRLGPRIVPGIEEMDRCLK